MPLIPNLWERINFPEIDCPCLLCKHVIDNSQLKIELIAIRPLSKPLKFEFKIYSEKCSCDSKILFEQGCQCGGI